MRKALIALAILAGIAVAQVTISRVEIGTYAYCKACNPGDYITVASDHGLVGAPKPTSGVTVFGSPSAPGCIAQATVGVYKFPVAPRSIAVYRGNIRAALPGEWTLVNDTLTLSSPIAGEQVTCDYTQ